MSESSATSAEPTTIFDVSNPKASLISLNMSNITKLTPSNFITWRLQISSLLEAHELHWFIIDEDRTPPEMITPTTGEPTTNPDFTAWNRQDKLLYSSLIGSLSLAVQPIVARATTSREIWQTVHRTYGNPSRGHIKQLKQQLKNITKGDQSIHEYMRTIINKTDQLALLGAALPHEDLLDVVTEGLGEDYRAIVEMVNGRDVPITLDELHEKLINREIALSSSDTSNASVPVTANTVQFRNQTNRGGFSGSRGRFSNSRGGFRPPRPYLGKCQICGVQGHGAKRCPQYQQPPALPQFQSHNVSPYRGPAPWLAPHLPLPPPQWQNQAHHTTTSSPDLSPWLLDSGASHHIASDLSNLSLHAPYNGGDNVLIGNGSGLPISHTGSAILPLTTRNLHLNNVLCVPDMKKNLISVNKLCKSNNVMVQLCPYDFQVKDLSTGTTLLNGKASEGVYEWPMKHIPSTTSISAFPCLKTSLSTWHSRLGHPHPQTLRHMISSFSLPLSSSLSSSLICNSCSSNKSHKLPFSLSTLVSKGPLDIIFSDVWTSPVLSVDGFKYYVIFVDHFTRYSWLYPLKTKSQVAQIFPIFKTLVENRFKARITTFYSDNGGEFIALRQFFATHGISHLTTPPHTPEHNGLAERRHRHIVETGLALLSHAGIPTSYWTYSFAAAVYLINRLTTPNLAHSSPFQLLFQSVPNYTKLRTFGCLCYPWLRPYGQNKFSPKSTPCVFMGYSLSQSAFLCLDVTTSRIYVSRHVEFHESVFPFRSLSKQSSSPPNMFSPSETVSASVVPVFHWPLAVDPCPAPSPAPITPPQPTPASSPLTHQSLPASPTSVSPVTTSSLSSSTASASSENSPENSVTVSLPDVAPIVSPPAAAPLAPTTHPMTTRSKNNIFKPNPRYGLTAILKEIEPESHTQAIKDMKWRRAMSDEYDAFAKNDTFELVDRALAKNIVGSKWVYRIKRLPDGSVERYKARLVAKGFHQRPGIDFHDTFSPVIKHATIRLILGTAVARNWPLKQLDVNNAFLQGPLEEEVYMQQPPGLVDKDHPHHVLRLKKAVYGLKQAPRAWYNALKDGLLGIGFKNSLADASLFVLRTGPHFVYILVYVDDIIITGSSMAEVSRVTSLLAARFSLKNLGDLSYFLGMEASRTPAGLLLTQTKYITDLLQKTKMVNSKPVATPMSSSDTLTLTTGAVLDDPTEYRATVGSLQYLGLTRPDIAFAVNRLSQYMHRPTTVHWDAVKRVLRYLAGTPTKGIFFSASSPSTLHAYSDADWAGSHDDYLSTGAYIVYLGKQPISWSSKKQSGVARSSTEAEYRALAAAASEVKWLTSLMDEIGLRSTTMPTIYCDNVGATYLSANPVFHSRMKHLALDYHFVREQVQAKTLRVSHISSADQLADALTKPLPRARFVDLTNKIGLCSRRPSCGGVLVS